MTKVFTLNIGNTHTQYGVWERGRVIGLSSVPTDRVDQIEFPTDTPIAAACVVPAARKIIEAKAPRVFWISALINTSVDFSLIDRNAMGADRVANAVALAETVNLPAIAIDCGTAITLETVNAHRVFCCGAIAPGRKLNRHALREHTALLPDVPLTNLDPPSPGFNTQDAIRVGVDMGAVGLVRELIAYARRELNVARCPVIITGGDRDFFARHIPETSTASVDFTLQGVGNIYRMNH